VKKMNSSTKKPRFSKPVSLLIKATGRKSSLSDWRAKISFFSKRIKHLHRGKEKAQGAHGKAFNLVLYKKGKKINLVIKKYHEIGWQNHLAKEDYSKFKKLKELGLSVPPTIALVQVGKKCTLL